MKLLTRAKVEDVLIGFEAGRLNREQTLLELLDMSQIPDFEGIWEFLIIHLCLLEIAAAQPRLAHLVAHWQAETAAWQQRLKRFANKPKASFRNAVRHDFEQARQQLLQNDAVKLVLNLELHLEETLIPDELDLAESVALLDLPAKEMAWFLEYDGNKTERAAEQT